jgi:hypothetical protein
MSAFKFYQHPLKIVGVVATVFTLTYFSSPPNRNYPLLLSPDREQDIKETAQEVQKEFNPEQTVQENQDRICGNFSTQKKFDCQTVLQEYYGDFQKQVKAGKPNNLPNTFEPTRVFARKYARETYDPKVHSAGHH